MPPAPYLIDGRFDKLTAGTLELHVPVSGDAIQVDPLRSSRGRWDVALLQVCIERGEHEAVTANLGHLAAAFTINYIAEGKEPTQVLSTPVSAIRFARAPSGMWSVEFTYGDIEPEILSPLGLRTFMNLVVGHSAERQGLQR